eukprot:236112-Pyramimonas_sp.AAC.1
MAMSAWISEQSMAPRNWVWSGLSDAPRQEPPRAIAPPRSAMGGGAVARSPPACRQRATRGAAG